MSPKGGWDQAMAVELRFFIAGEPDFQDCGSIRSKAHAPTAKLWLLLWNRPELGDAEFSTQVLQRFERNIPHNIDDRELSWIGGQNRDTADFAALVAHPDLDVLVFACDGRCDSAVTRFEGPA